MLPIILLYVAGCGYLFLALWFRSRNPAEITLIDPRMEANFAGDVEAWLRSEGY